MSSAPSAELKLEIKNLIINTLGISNVTPNEVDDELPLFSGENHLTLDSVDALEIIMALQRQYKIRIGDQNLARSIIRSINSIAEFIQAEKEKQINKNPG